MVVINIENILVFFKPEYLNIWIWFLSNSLIKKRDIKSSLPKNSSTKDQLKEYKQLFDEGLISEEEYTLLKKKALDI